MIKMSQTKFYDIIIIYNTINKSHAKIVKNDMHKNELKVSFSYPTCCPEISVLFTACFGYFNSTKLQIWVHKKIVQTLTFLWICNFGFDDFSGIFGGFYKMIYQSCRVSGLFVTETILTIATLLKHFFCLNMKCS